MRKPLVDPKIFQKRRDQLAKTMQDGSALVLMSHPEMIRNYDVHHPYRQNTDMFYLTGFEESQSVLVFIPGSENPTTLFVKKKDPTMETWEGFHFGVDGAKEAFQVDQTFPIDELEERLPKMIVDCSAVYYSQNHHYGQDEKINGVLRKVRALRGRSGEGNIPLMDSYPLIGELRVIKSEFEQNEMRSACKISSEAHIELMRATRPGINERALHGLFIKEIKQRGAAREGYGTIVAGGNNAVTLHYVFNDCDLVDGEMILIDAGAEYHYYTGDITRTYPINGEFSAAQRKLYEGVLKVQKNLVDAVKPGTTFKDLNEQMAEGLTDILLEVGILKGDRKKLLEGKTNAEKAYFKFCPHGVGHFLGSDVHDAGKSKKDRSRPLEAGMCLTIEPGLYISKDDTDVAAEFRGIGIRIEDNLLVTPDGNENMTAKCPKEIDDLESLIGSNSDIWAGAVTE
ncbi:MAG: aminopeptidase P N-terminal domain-containing protein [Bdellovibrionales bacterium]